MSKLFGIFGLVLLTAGCLQQAELAEQEETASGSEALEIGPIDLCADAGSAVCVSTEMCYEGSACEELKRACREGNVEACAELVSAGVAPDGEGEPNPSLLESRGILTTTHEIAPLVKIAGYGTAYASGAYRRGIRITRYTSFGTLLGRCIFVGGRNGPELFCY